jgi:hypothetical protein
LIPPKEAIVREKNVRCRDCGEKHDPSDRCAEVKQQQLPLWKKKAGDRDYTLCDFCGGEGEVPSCEECHEKCQSGKCHCTYCDEDGPYALMAPGSLKNETSLIRKP